MRNLSSAQLCAKARCPTGEQRTTTPRSASGLSPRYTSSPSSAMPGGAGPRLCSDDAGLAEVGGDAAPVFNGTHRHVKGGFRAGWRRDHVQVVQEGNKCVIGMEHVRMRPRPAGGIRAYSAGARASPCSQPSPWQTSRQRPAASNQQYVEGLPEKRRTKGGNSGATSRSLPRNAARDMLSYALRPSRDQHGIRARLECGAHVSR